MANSVNGVQAKFNHTWTLLKVTYGLLFVIAGIDKFFDVIVIWQKYINPQIITVLRLNTSTINTVISVIEIVIGLLILTKWTRIGAYLAATWFVIIVVNLLLMWQYIDIAVRDLVLAIGAISLAWLTEIRNEVRH